MTQLYSETFQCRFSRSSYTSPHLSWVHSRRPSAQEEHCATGIHVNGSAQARATHVCKSAKSTPFREASRQLGKKTTAAVKRQSVLNETRRAWPGSHRRGLPPPGIAWPTQTTSASRLLAPFREHMHVEYRNASSVTSSQPPALHLEPWLATPTSRSCVAARRAEDGGAYINRDEYRSTPRSSDALPSCTLFQSDIHPYTFANNIASHRPTSQHGPPR